MTKARDMLTRGEVMSLTGLGDSTIWRYIELGVFPPSKWCVRTNVKYWDRADINLWITANGTGPLRSSQGPQDQWRSWLDIQTDPRLNAPDREQVVDLSKNVANYLDELNNKHGNPGEEPVPGKTDVEPKPKDIMVSGYTRGTGKVRAYSRKSTTSRPSSTPRKSSTPETVTPKPQPEFTLRIPKRWVYAALFICAIAAAWYVGRTY